jgi:hypothetical protein
MQASDIVLVPASRVVIILVLLKNKCIQGELEWFRRRLVTGGTLGGARGGQIGLVKDRTYN